MKQQPSRKKNKSKKRANRQPINRLMLALALLCVVVLIAGFFVDFSAFARKDTAADLLSLRFNEYQSDNAGALLASDGTMPDWIELKNTGEAPVSLKGVSIALDAKFNKAFAFPDITLNPGEMILVYADGVTGSAGSELHAGFRLNASGGETLSLFDAANQLLDSVETVELASGASCGRDAQGQWQISAVATPAKENGFVSENTVSTYLPEVHEGAVVLSEAMSSNASFFPDETGAVHDYIELRNVTGSDVNLEGYALSDDPASLMKWRFPHVILPAGGTLAVHCSGLDRTGNPAHLHTNFRLSSDGERVFLSDPNQTLISAVALPALKTDQAYSLLDGKWTTTLAPTPNRENSPAAAEQANAQTLSASGSSLYISEVFALSSDVDNQDWIELYNDSDSPVSLGGYGLSDNAARPRKWQFPAGITIEPHQYYCVILVGSNPVVDSKGYLTADFALDADGGYPVCLSDSNGKILDRMYLPVQYPDVSYGRSSRSGRCGYYTIPTPTAENAGTPLADRVRPAEYSVSGGIFHAGDSFDVTLTAESDAKIYYTLDCTDPTPASALYDGTPIHVDGSTILRARVYRDGCLESLTNTQSYLYDINNATDVDYVVSLVSDPDNLYSDERGIMIMGSRAYKDFPYGDTNRGANFWMDWEREAHVELFKNGAEQVISQNCGIKIHGRNTRAYELKSFKVIARESYGDGLFRYPIFSNRNFADCDSFMLRYTGQDYKYTFMRDPVFVSLAADTDVLYQEAEVCVVYINGEYYSAMYIRENIDPYFICQCNGWEGQEDDIDLVKGANKLMQGTDTDYEELKAWLNANDTSTQEAYDRIAAIIDIDNFIQYSTLTIVLAPPDTVDVKRYRNPLADGKWKWAIYDFDRCLRGDLDGFALMAQGSYRALFNAFMNNEPLRERFLDYFARSLADTFTSQRMRDMVDAQYEKIKPVLPDYLANLNLTQRHYKSKLDVLIRRVGRTPKVAMQQCAAYLNIPEDEARIRFADAIQKAEEYAASAE